MELHDNFTHIHN